MKAYILVTVSAFVCLVLPDANELQAQTLGRNELYPPALFGDLSFRMVGPTRGGRVTTVTGIAEQPGTFYMGATGGGVWKTTDYGQSWRNVSDGYFQTASIGAIQVADSDPNIVYVGTGSDGIRSNVIPGRGVYKSTDAGKTWAFLGLRDVGQIGAVEVNPRNPNLVFVAAIGHAFGPNPDRGVYRSSDGGATWAQVLFLTDSTGAVDLEFAPDNPLEIYASMWRGERKPWTIVSGANEGGVYKSSDGGDTWMELTNGLPRGIRGKSDLAVSRSDPNRVYVLYEAPEGEGGLYRSDDRGASFRLVSMQASLLDRPFYYLNVDADPSNADVLYVNSTGFFRSTDGGATWRERAVPHGDNHDIWINPNDPDLYIQSNDGGANVTRDGGETWSTQFNQPTAELYQVYADDQFPYWLYAGQQDNTTIMVPSAPPYTPEAGHSGFWRAIGGCETGPAVPKPGDPNIVYSNCKGRFGRYNKTTGQEQQFYVGAANMYGHNPRDLDYRFQRVSPIEVSPHNPNIVYHGSQFLHKTTDEGVTWETISPDLTAFDPATQVISGSPITRDITGEEFHSTLYAVEESPLAPGLIWTGANDGPVFVTRDGGATWTNVTPPDLLPHGRVQAIDPSPHRPGKAYVAIYRTLLDDYRPYIYRTEDYGRSWTHLTTGTNGIPADFPTRVVREDPDREGLLYAGTEFGLFISFDDGAHWQSFQQNLPATPVTDIRVHHKDLVLATMGRAFWIMDNVTLLHQLASRHELVMRSEAYLFQPREAYRMRYSPMGGSPDQPQYPPPGAIFDYYLAGDPAGDLKIEILDAKGVIVRTIPAQASAGQSGSSDPFMTGRRGGGGGAPLVKREWHSRFVWDLRHDAAAGAAGPLVVPGTYQVRLSAGEWSQSRPLEVRIDPRVAAAGVTQADLQEQLDLALKVRDAIAEARALGSKLVAARQALQPGAANEKTLQALVDRVVTASVVYPQPMLADQLSNIARMIGRADQKVGRDAFVRFDDLMKEMTAVKAEAERLGVQ